VQLAALQLQQQLQRQCGSSGWQQPHAPGFAGDADETARRHWELHGNAFSQGTALGRQVPFRNLCSTVDAPQAPPGAFVYSTSDALLDSPMHAQRSLKVSEGVSSARQGSGSLCAASCQEAVHVYATSGSACGAGLDSCPDSYSSMQGGVRPCSATKRTLAGPEGALAELVSDLNSFKGLYGEWRQPGPAAPPPGVHRPSKRQLFP
jgi:hypothetical protein